MPTYAAGAQPGQLQSVYEMLGPDTAYFLGGAIALHPRGFASGAKLCMNILNAARQLADEAVKKGNKCGKPLPSALIEEIESYGTHAWYTDPSAVFVGGLKPFYRC
ncbi:MAG TPA: hypothetical protein VF311_03330 [Terriglobales bacterium]